MITAGRRHWLAIAVLAAVTFANTWRNPFQFDDLHSVQYNPHIRSLRFLPDYFVDPATFSSHPSGYMYRPLLLTSYAANYLVGGTRVGGYRLVNLVLHGLASGLVVSVGLGLGLPAATAWTVGFLALVHPARSEVVNLISSRSDLLVAVLVLLGMILARQSAHPLRLGFCYLAALLSKSTAITMLPLIGLQGNRLHGIGKTLRWQSWSLLLTVTLAYAGVLWATRFLGESMASRPRGWLQHFSLQGKALVYQLWLHVSPVHLSVEHAVGEGRGAGELVGVFSLVAMLSVLYLSLRQPSRVGFGLLWFVLAMLPYIAIPLNLLVAERRSYLAGAGLALAVGWGWGRFQTRLRHSGRLGWAFGAVLILLTVQRNSVWASQEQLWRDAVSKAPGSVRGRVNLAISLRDRGEVVAATAELDTALEINPHYVDGLVLKGSLLGDIGDLHGAQRAYEEASRLAPEIAGVHHNLGNIYLTSGDREAAIRAFDAALAADPAFAEARNNLGQALEQSGRLAAALYQYERAVGDSLFWTHTKDPVGGAWFNLAQLREHQGDREGARSAYGRAAEALQTDPKWEEFAQRARDGVERLSAESR